MTNTMPKVLQDWIEHYVAEVVPYYQERLAKLLALPKHGLAHAAREAGFTQFEYELQWHTHEPEWLEKQVRRDAEHYAKRLIARVEKKCGNITNTSELYFELGELNGCVYGDKSKAYVTSITAGGYNVQCLHTRVLVK